MRCHEPEDEADCARVEYPRLTATLLILIRGSVCVHTGISKPPSSYFLVLSAFPWYSVVYPSAKSCYQHFFVHSLTRPCMQPFASWQIPSRTFRSGLPLSRLHSASSHSELSVLPFTPRLLACHQRSLPSSIRTGPKERRPGKGEPGQEEQKESPMQPTLHLCFVP